MVTHYCIVSVTKTEEDKMKQLIYYSEEMSTIFSMFPVFLSTARNKRTFSSPGKAFQIKYILEG